MLNVFTLANGRLFQEEIDSLEELAQFKHFAHCGQGHFIAAFWHDALVLVFDPCLARMQLLEHHPQHTLGARRRGEGPHELVIALVFG